MWDYLQCKESTHKLPKRQHYKVYLNHGDTWNSLGLSPSTFKTYII